MTGLVANVLLDVLLVGLLTATIGYCYILNRRIKVLQDSKSELAALLRQFDESTVKASETIVAMQTASKRIGDNIQMRIDKANYLLDDLSYNIDKGTRLASQLEASFAISRARSQADHFDENAFTAVAKPKMEPEAENGVSYEKHTRHHTKREPASIESIVEKVVSRNKSSAEQPSEGRSRAEQELIELIRTANKG